MTGHRFVAASGFWLRLFNWLQIDAITMPWRTVYIRAKYLDEQSLRAHELIHIEQIDRHGAIWFSILYLWYLARHGYWEHPLEIEAYRSYRRQHEHFTAAPDHEEAEAAPGPGRAAGQAAEAAEAGHAHRAQRD